MDKQHISSHENGGAHHDRPSMVETHDHTPRRRDNRIHQVQSGRGKSVQWKPKSNDNQSSISPNSAENRASISRNSSPDLGFQSHLPHPSPLYYESKDTHMADNRASTSRNSSPDLGFQTHVPHPSPLYYESKDTHMADNRASTSRNSSSNLGFQSHVPHPSLLYESKDTHMAKNRASTSQNSSSNPGIQSHVLHPSPLYEPKNTHIAENRATIWQNSSSNIGFQSHVPHPSPSNDTHSIEGSQINECSGEETRSPSSSGRLSIEEPAIPHQRHQYISKSKDIIIDATSSENSEEHTGSSFDICPPPDKTLSALKPSLFVQNREARKENKHRLDNSKHLVLRPGMVLLKGYLKSDDQIQIVHRCRHMGKNNGGFYNPGYRDGAKLQLKMMCLGRNWEPETGLYTPKRSCDGSYPPEIPLEFLQIVQDVIQKSQELVSLNPESGKQEDIPSMIPDICIVNFYSARGKLGLHQDKDESHESISQGLPVISFSVGDSGDFLYGDGPDIEKAEKILLESGDVLVFGGDSRRVFHGVSAIHKNSAPTYLHRRTNILPGRLNLTFRKY